MLASQPSHIFEPIPDPRLSDPQVRHWYDETGLTDELARFYAQLGAGLPFADLLLEIRNRFGARLLAEISLPHGMDQNTCLMLAVTLAQESLQVKPPHA